MKSRFDRVVGEDGPSPEQPKAKPKKFTVVVQKWEESERGWGTRPDGWTMHLSEEDRAAFVKAYYAKYNPPGPAPDCYTRVDGDPYLMDVNEETYKKVEASENGIWGDGNMPPSGKQGRNGWKNVG